MPLFSFPIAPSAKPGIMLDNTSLLAIVQGRVQGVYFRLFVQKEALSLGLTGYTRNLSDGKSVEVRAEGQKQKLEELVRILNIGPPRAMVEKVDTRWSAYSGVFETFDIRY